MSLWGRTLPPQNRLTVAYKHIYTINKLNRHRWQHCPTPADAANKKAIRSLRIYEKTSNHY